MPVIDPQFSELAYDMSCGYAVIVRARSEGLKNVIASVSMPFMLRDQSFFDLAVLRPFQLLDHSARTYGRELL
jgi:hypothetical protein